MDNFLLIMPIGLEAYALKEIKLKKLDQDIKKYQIIKGAIEIECELLFGLSLNKKLRGVSRVLLRLKKQKCRDFPKLYKILKSFNYHPFLTQDKAQFKISTSKSRIINTKKALKCAEDAFKNYIKSYPIKESLIKRDENEEVQSFYIRIYEDELTLSIDSTGLLQHIRGERNYRGLASLRETYASLLLSALYDEKDQNKSLIDPMCGTGTFLYEALNYFQPLKRDHIYQRWPLIKKLTNPSEQITELNLFKEYIGLDKVINTEKFFTQSTNQKISFHQHDLFRSDFIKEGIYILNPPYGKRIKIKENFTEYFETIIKTILYKFKAQKLGIIIPSQVKIKYKALLKFNNNGIMVSFYIIENSKEIQSS